MNYNNPVQLEITRRKKKRKKETSLTAPTVTPKQCRMSRRDKPSALSISAPILQFTVLCSSHRTIKKRKQTTSLANTNVHRTNTNLRNGEGSISEQWWTVMKATELEKGRMTRRKPFPTQNVIAWASVSTEGK